MKLHNLLIYPLFIILISCSNDTKESEEWIEMAKKPISVYEGETGNKDKFRYTLIDADFMVHETGVTPLKLPNVIGN